MLVLKLLKINILYLLLILLISSNVYANTEYYKCPEKVTNVIKSEGKLIKTGSILGVNYIKFSGINTPNKKVTIKFKNQNGKKKTRKIVTLENLIENSLGYEFYNKFSDENETIENNYNFVKLVDSYAFTRTEFYWSLTDKSQNKKNYEYEASGRCTKIKKVEFETEKKLQVAKKKEKKDKKKPTKSKIIDGERSFAMSWSGYDDLILGKMKFIENDLVGKLEFSLPEKDGNCIGTYVLSKTKGTWSIYCEKRNVNASGTLKWNNANGAVNGDGKDNNGQKIKFKIAPNT